jgi:hypothetical protein
MPIKKNSSLSPKPKSLYSHLQDIGSSPCSKQLVKLTIRSFINCKNTMAGLRKLHRAVTVSEPTTSNFNAWLIKMIFYEMVKHHLEISQIKLTSVVKKRDKPLQAMDETQEFIKRMEDEHCACSNVLKMLFSEITEEDTIISIQQAVSKLLQSN